MCGVEVLPSLGLNVNPVATSCLGPRGEEIQLLWGSNLSNILENTPKQTACQHPGSSLLCRAHGGSFQVWDPPFGVISAAWSSMRILQVFPRMRFGKKSPAAQES